jgi:hypothetical protein
MLMEPCTAQDVQRTARRVSLMLICLTLSALLVKIHLISLCSKTNVSVMIAEMISQALISNVEVPLIQIAQKTA